MKHRLRSCVVLACLALPLAAAPLSKSHRIDFFRDVPSRNLQGLATRSDGRLVAGPVLRDLTGDVAAPLLWSMIPLGRDSWLVGTGPEGRVMRLSINARNATFSLQPWADLGAGHVYALLALPDGSVLAGTSPRGGLHLVRDGRVIASAHLPVDSIFDLLALDDDTVVVGTGNPGRLYRLRIPTFASSGTDTDTVSDATSLAARGIEMFGTIRDRNVRRLALAADGRVLAGSAPSGNLYSFPNDGGAPELLFDNTRAEVTDIRVEDNGDVYAIVVFSGSPGGPLRVLRQSPEATEPPEETTPTPVRIPETSDSPPVERFSGRSALMWIPGGNGFPETLASRSNIAVYRMGARGDLLLMLGGDAGEIVGYDRSRRRSLTFGGSTSAQLTAFAPLGPDQFLVMENNPAGFAILDFKADGPRRAETRRIDLRTPSQIGALRFNRIRAVEAKSLGLELRANRADDEVEGWTAWTPASHADGGWTAPGLRGRFAQVRLELPSSIPPDLELDSAELFHLPQNRRPTLQSFRIISPNFALLPRSEGPATPMLTLGQVIGASESGGARDDARSALLASQIVPQPGAQIVYWTIDDADGDALAASFSIRREGSDRWTDLIVDTRESWMQFDRSHLEDGVYFTRLVVREQAPRAEKERLEVIFETDDLVIDHTAPTFESAAAEIHDGRLRISVRGRDARSLLAGIEIALNNGHRTTVEQPADGILDSPHETFVAEIALTDVSSATSAEIILHDQSGNSAAKRLPLPK